MTANGWIQIAIYCAIVTLLVKPFGGYMTRVFTSGRLHRGDDVRGRQAGDRPGAGRLAGGHQEARHERRRLLQRQFRPSVREPERDHQSGRRCADLRDRRRAHQRLRPHGRRPAPGLGDLRGHGRAVPGRRRDRLWAEAAGNPAFAAFDVDRRRARCRPAATWKARRSASASPIRRCSRP